MLDSDSDSDSSQQSNHSGIDSDSRIEIVHHWYVASGPLGNVMMQITTNHDFL